MTKWSIVTSLRKASLCEALFPSLHQRLSLSELRLASSLSVPGVYALLSLALDGENHPSFLPSSFKGGRAQGEP